MFSNWAQLAVSWLRNLSLLQIKLTGLFVCFLRKLKLSVVDSIIIKSFSSLLLLLLLLLGYLNGLIILCYMLTICWAL